MPPAVPSLGVLLLALAALAALLPCPAQALTCYDCATTLGFNDACKNPSNVTATEPCTSSNCLTTITLGSTLLRGCNTFNFNAGCTGLGSLSVCYYTCTTDLCNVQAGAPGLAPLGGTGALAALALAALSLSRGLAAA